jgi:hypothetical protein
VPCQIKIEHKNIFYLTRHKAPNSQAFAKPHNTMAAPAAPILTGLFDEELVLVEQLAEIEGKYYLVHLLRENRINDYLTATATATPAALIAVVEWTAARGLPQLMLPALSQIKTTGLAILYHLQNSHDNAIQNLLDSPVYSIMPTKHDMYNVMEYGTLTPNKLRTLLRHPKGRHLLYQVEAPGQIQQLAGWGFSSILQRHNQTYRAYEQIIQEEKAIVRANHWRVLFWIGIVLRIRLIEFQARYWAVGGPGYLAAKASFDALISK